MLVCFFVCCCMRRCAQNLYRVSHKTSEKHTKNVQNDDDDDSIDGDDDDDDG